MNGGQEKGGAAEVVLPECPARAHNTWDSAYAKPSCICPGGQRRRSEIRHRNAARKRRARGAGFMPVWWSGPWRIADACESPNHHTVRAMSRGESRCVCPRSLSLAEGEAERKAEYARRRRATIREHRARVPGDADAGRSVRPGVPRWYSGPWRIAEDCPAAGHFTRRWGTKPPSGEKCVCPRTRALLDVMRLHVTPRRRSPVVAAEFSRPVRMTVGPDFRRAACAASKTAQAIADGGFNAAETPEGAAARHAARAQCETCPIMQACRSWAAQEEYPPGSWGGVWGGLDPWQREELFCSSDDSEKEKVA